MSDKIYFSLGPVQGFVAQSRRTRDLWSGSFLLSYLSACAINEVAKKGQILVPDIKDDPLLSWIKEPGKGNAPEIGTIPNRFVASADNPKSVAEAAAVAIQKRWMDIADAVWTKFLADLAENGKGTKAIWDRQVQNFWEISWVVAPEISAMNARKNWRISRHLEDEPGDHCTMMGDWQELSGYIRSTEGKKQKYFWEQLALHVGKLDLREGERLCALALIKRLLPKVSDDSRGLPVSLTNWPSTPYVAAIPWLSRVLELAADDARDYANQVLENTSYDALRKGISRKIGSFSSFRERFLDLDGNFYFENAVADCKRTPLKNTQMYIKNCEEEFEAAKKKRTELIDQLNKLVEKAGRPNPFYAMLLMDGDNMGKLIRDHGEEPITQALSEFTKEVQSIVRGHDGVTIYAGGDDVLAMLPLTKALGCALYLSKNYEACFKDDIPGATISAGLVYSHYHIPLSTVMREAHHILDDVAKDQNGRNSIAVSVLKNSGKYCQWTVTWDRLTDEKGNLRIDDLASKTQEGSTKQFSKSFFYGMRDDLSILSGDQISKPGSYAELIDGLDPLALLTAEYMKSREQTVTRQMAEERVRSLLELSYRSRNFSRLEKTVLSPDAAMLIKFLSQTAGGVE